MIVLKHPVVIVFFVLLVVRLITLITEQYIEALGVVPVPLLSVMWNMLVVSGTTGILAGSFLLAWRYLFLPRLVMALTCITGCLLLLWSIADPIIFKIAGDHLTPSLFQHFAGMRIFTSDYLWKPITSNRVPVLSGLVVFGLLTIVYAWLYRLSLKTPRTSPGIIPVLSLLVTSLLVMSLPGQFGFKHIDGSPEWIFVQDLLHMTNTKLDHGEQESIQQLRTFVGLPQGSHWISDKYPLVHSAPVSNINSTGNKPDIVIIVIESLRGENMPWVSDENTFALPMLEHLAKQAVVFPYFISNGFPSTEGFMSINYSGWPHRRLRIAAEFQHIEFDGLAKRLGLLGYQTVHFVDKPDFDEEDFWVNKDYQKTITYTDRKIFPSERNMVNDIIKYISDVDIKPGHSPFFLYLKTSNPHLPYEIPDDNKGKHFSVGTPRDNYPLSMAYVDNELGRLFKHLDQRQRKNNTVLIILGDHANYLDESLATGLPVNDSVWTSALFAAPERYIGKPRRETIAASQVDIMPTLLAMIGDDRPTASLGHNLFKPERKQYYALAIRPGGIRIDISGQSMIIDHRRTQSPWIHVFGEYTHSNHNVSLPDSEQLLDIVNTWSYLIEQNRIWNPDFLK